MRFSVGPGLAAVATQAWREAVALAIERSPSPPVAAAGFERLLEAGGAQALASWPETELDNLAVILGSSPVLTRYLASHADGWAEAASAYRHANPDVAELAAHAKVPATTDPDGLAAVLRLMAKREMYRIGTRDLLGMASLEDTLAAITALADVAISAAVSHLRCYLARDGGDVIAADGKPLGFVVLGLGKLGGADLNYSSDVDLLYLYDGDLVARGSREARPFFSRLAAAVTAAIGDRTEDGCVFRVDLDLRPEGSNGPLVNAVDNALTYYEGWGDTWERGVYIKARPVAGDSRVGERFIAGIEPFVYRRHLDFQTVEDFRAMKDRIDAEQANAWQSSEHSRNVKLGRGGIRELEFVVQVLQLIHGGVDSSLRLRGTMQALAALESGEMIAGEQAQLLREAYVFLRNLEHAIQVVEQSQTQRLPDDQEGLRWLARRLGYGLGRRGRDTYPGDPLVAFEKDWQRHTDAVHEAFVRFLELRPGAAGAADGDRETGESDADAAALLRFLERGREDEAAGLLERLGFADGHHVAANIMRLYRGRVAGPASPQRRRAVEAMAPALLKAALASSDPSSAVDRMVEFLVRTGAHTSYLALLSGSPATMEVLIRLFTMSPYLAAHLVGHPELIDSLVRSDAGVVGRSAEFMRVALNEELRASDGEEQVLAILRHFRVLEVLRIGLADLGGAIGDEEVHEQLSRLAEACLGGAADQARSLLEARLGDVAAVDLAVVAMGKMGGREMSYGSDLDLLFVYDSGGEQFDAVAHDVSTRWAQKTMSLLQSRTGDGLVYQIDTRLRPSGSSGPLVVSLARFRRYHEKEAELWERQAHLRARTVYGSDDLRGKVAATIESFVYGCGLEDAGLREIDELRVRVENERGRESPDRLNIKTGRGGIVDIEFIVQMLQLRHGHEIKELRCRSTLKALRALHSAGILPDHDARLLIEHYRFLRRLEARMRLERNRPVEELGVDPRTLGPLAKRLGFSGTDGGQRLLKVYAKTTAEVRALYERWFERDVDV